MRKANKIRYIILAFLLGIISVMFGGGGIASADINRSYSNVADDLRKDGNFNAWEYPAKATDYSLQVIQIAESAAGELFVYVYQPSGAVADLRATCINMTLSEEVNGTDLYNLKYLNSSGVFYKYIAEGVKVSSAVERLYNITSIYREWNEDYDKGTGNDNTIDEAVFEVGKLTAMQSNNTAVRFRRQLQQANAVMVKGVAVSVSVSNGTEQAFSCAELGRKKSVSCGEVKDLQRYCRGYGATMEFLKKRTAIF